MQSVLQDWVMKLPLREQGTLLTVVRGCDLTPKNPLDSPERKIVGQLRNAFMVPADQREVGIEPGSFFVHGIPTPKTFKASAFGHYPQHWVAHVMHAIEVLGYRHPNKGVQMVWRGIYLKFCHDLHVNPETFEQFKKRLSEDRIAAGTVVS